MWRSGHLRVEVECVERMFGGMDDGLIEARAIATAYLILCGQEMEMIGLSAAPCIASQVGAILW